MNVCGDVKTRLAVFEFVQREAEVAFFVACEYFGDLSEPAVVTKKGVCRVSLFVINFITTLAAAADVGFVMQMSLWSRAAVNEL